MCICLRAFAHADPSVYITLPPGSCMALPHGPPHYLYLWCTLFVIYMLRPSLTTLLIYSILQPSSINTTNNHTHSFSSCFIVSPLFLSLSSSYLFNLLILLIFLCLPLLEHEFREGKEFVYLFVAVECLIECLTLDSPQ